MGIYDRDYYREERPRWSFPTPRSVTTTLILVTAVIYMVDWSLGWKLSTEYLAVSVGTLTRPQLWWQFLTYGFVHFHQPGHIILNMITLWFFGPPIEEQYGKKEFLRLYLVFLVVSALVWALIGKFIEGALEGERVIGASGAVTGIVILFVLNFPQARVALFFVLPVPAWVLGILLVAGDVWGAMGREDLSRIAYTIHLSGAAFALLYHQLRWNLGRLVPGRIPWRSFRRRPHLRLHLPKDEDEKLNDEVDRILQKISLQGEASLTRRERRTLQSASRRFQQKRHATEDSDR